MTTERMSKIPERDMTEPQRKALDEVMSGPRGKIAGGPFVPLLRSPGLMSPLAKVGEYLRFGSVLDKRIIELATLIAARHWSQQFEWQAHYTLALKAGLAPAIADAIAQGARPAKMAEDEEIAFELLVELAMNKSVSDRNYNRAAERFGEQGVVELVGVAGYYSMLAMVMNVARTAPLAGSDVNLLPEIPNSHTGNLMKQTEKPTGPVITRRTGDDDFKRDGLRSFAVYRDLGLQNATDGGVHAHIIRMVEPSSETTRERHAHLLDCQFFYVLKGWMKLEFDGHGEVTVHEGDCVFMPAGIKHTVLDYSVGLENLEVVMPAQFETVRVD